MNIIFFDFLNFNLMFINCIIFIHLHPSRMLIMRHGLHLHRFLPVTNQKYNTGTWPSAFPLRATSVIHVRHLAFALPNDTTRVPSVKPNTHPEIILAP